jgi:hypothetical protein
MHMHTVSIIALQRTIDKSTPMASRCKTAKLGGLWSIAYSLALSWNTISYIDTIRIFQMLVDYYSVDN